MGYHFQKSGFTEFDQLMKSVVQDMVSAGFDLVHTNADYSNSDIDLDTIDVVLNESTLVESIDYSEIIDANPDGTVTVDLTVAPAATDRLVGNFEYVSDSTPLSGVISPDVPTGVNTNFKSKIPLPSSRYTFDLLNTSGLRIVKTNGATYFVPTNAYNATVYNTFYLQTDITDTDFIPSDDNYTIDIDTRVKANLHIWNSYDPALVADAVFSGLPTKTATITYDLSESTLKTISGGDYTNFTNIDGSELVTSAFFVASGSSPDYSLGDGIIVSSIVTSVDYSTVTIQYDMTALSDTQYTNLESNFNNSAIVIKHEAYYDEADLVLDGVKGFTDTFFSPEILSSDNLVSEFDFSVLPAVYVDAVLQTEGVDYTYSVSENKLRVEFVSGSIPVDGTTVTFDFNYFPRLSATEVPLIGTKNGSNTIFELSLKFSGDFYILEAGSQVDPLNSSQPWRVAIDSGFEENLPLYKISSDWVGTGLNARTLDASIQDTFELVPLQSQGVGHYNLNLKTVKNYGKFYIGTPVQLQDDGTVAAMPLSKEQIGPYGRIYDTYTNGLLWTGIINYSETTIEYDQPTDDNFVLAKSYAITNSLDINNTRPMSYDLSVSDRGFVLMLKSDGRDDGKGNYFIATQRLVDAKDGTTLTTGHSPVVSLYHQEYIDATGNVVLNLDGTVIEGVSYILDRKYDINMMIARESDVHTPAKPVPVYNNSPYINGIWNKEKQLSINDREEYLIIIPDGINTHRHLYSNKRMDMIAFCSANIIMEGGIAKVTVHNEPQQREYKAQRASIGYVEGWRMLQLIKNGGV